MTKIAYLGEAELGEKHVCVRVTSDGQCELMFECGDHRCIFPCSLSSLINVGLGARSHLASDYGGCALVRTAGGVKIELTPWGQETEYYFVPSTVFANAMAELATVGSMRDKVTLR